MDKIPTKSKATPDFRPSSSIKWGILIFGSLMIMCDYYTLTLPMSLQELTYDLFKEQYTEYPDFIQDFSLMFTLYNVPNMILPLFNGFLTTKVLFLDSPFENLA